MNGEYISGEMFAGGAGAVIDALRRGRPEKAGKLAANLGMDEAEFSACVLQAFTGIRAVRSLMDQEWRRYKAAESRLEW